MFLHLVALNYFDFALFFIFQRHNTIEHGGRLSRSKRNAALQVNILFFFFLSCIFHFTARLSTSRIFFIYIFVLFCEFSFISYNFYFYFVTDTNQLPVSTNK